MRAFAEKQNQPQQKSSAGLTRSNRLLTAASQSANPLMYLQRTIGNQATLRLLQAGANCPEASSDTEASPTTEIGSETPTTTRFAHDFSRIPVHTPAPITIQPKLTVNTPEDIYEQEADHIAQQVMRMLEPKLQPACACGGGCPSCQTEQPGQEHQRLQTKRVGSGDSGPVAAPPIVHEVLASPGQPLDASARAFFEPRFGHDFSHVRVHTDAKAASSAHAVNAWAYTVGQNVVFASGLYMPQSNEGRSLLAHELSHVLQQRSSQVLQKRRTSGDIGAFIIEEMIRNLNLEQEIIDGILNGMKYGRKFKFKGSNDHEIEDNVRAHIAARKGIVDFAAANSFAYNPKRTKMNPEYWEDNGEKTWTLKDESRRMEAYQDMHKNSGKYQLECKQAAQMTMRAGSGSAGIVIDDNIAQNDWIPGDWGHIKNVGTHRNLEAGEYGENIIYLGNGQFWGLSNSRQIRTLRDWFDLVKSWSGAAEIQGFRKGPNTGLL
jgi:hypothetical protein